jgi:hypothetical protein
MGETGLRLVYDFALVPRSALIPDSHSDRLPNGKVPAGPAGVQALQNARIGVNVFWLKAARIVPKGGPRRDI